MKRKTTVEKFHTLEIEYNDTPYVIIAKLNKIIAKVNPTDPSMMVDGIDDGYITFKNERPMTAEEQVEWDEKYMSQEAKDKQTYVELKLKYGW